MNETYRKVLQIFVMKNYAALVAKLQSRNFALPRDYFAVSALCSSMCYIGCDWHNFNMAMGQKRYKSLHGCIFAMKHFFKKSLESLALFHVLCRKKCLRSFKIMQLQRLGVNAQTDTHRQTHTQTDCYNPPPTRSG